jgi:putative glutamine amidotransferase
VSAPRDAFELALVHEALERDLPLLGICRGMQVVNVALGGTLYRDRSEYPPRARAHPGGDWARWERVCAAALGLGAMPEHPSHPISVASGTLLAAALGERAVVNSYHHQALDRLGAGVSVVARADDGIVEAIELPGRTFALGVQWELQESWRHGAAGMAVFEAFVAAAAGRRVPAARDRRRLSPPAPATARRPPPAAPAAPPTASRR